VNFLENEIRTTTSRGPGRLNRSMGQGRMGLLVLVVLVAVVRAGPAAIWGINRWF